MFAKRKNMQDKKVVEKNGKKQKNRKFEEKANRYRN